MELIFRFVFADKKTGNRMGGTMSRDSILKIKETEQAADQLIEDARLRAKEMIERAEREGRELCAEAEERTAAMAERVSEEANSAAEEMRKNAALRQRSAEKIVVRGLMSKCR